MNNQKLGHHLIESLLSLLNNLEQGGIDIYRVMEARDEAPSFADSRDLKTAWEIIRFMDEMPGGFLIYQAGG